MSQRNHVFASNVTKKYIYSILRENDNKKNTPIFGYKFEKNTETNLFVTFFGP